MLREQPETHKKGRIKGSGDCLLLPLFSPSFWLPSSSMGFSSGLRLNPEGRAQQSTWMRRLPVLGGDDLLLPLLLLLLPEAAGGSLFPPLAAAGDCSLLDPLVLGAGTRAGPPGRGMVLCLMGGPAEEEEPPPVLLLCLMALSPVDGMAPRS